MIFNMIFALILSAATQVQFTVCGLTNSGLAPLYAQPLIGVGYEVGL